MTVSVATSTVLPVPLVTCPRCGSTWPSDDASPVCPVCAAVEPNPGGSPDGGASLDDRDPGAA